MTIAAIEELDVERIAPLVAAFRVSLKKHIGINSMPDLAAGQKELLEYLKAGYPCFAALEQDEFIGYLVCRVEKPTVWVESLFVKLEFRRQGIATELLHAAEAIAASNGEETVFNFVHPNNHAMIEFLIRNGYSVLNLIEIRKPYPHEVFTQKINVGEHEFDFN